MQTPISNVVIFSDDVLQEAKERIWLRLSDEGRNSNGRWTDGRVNMITLKQFVSGLTLPDQAGNAGKFLQTDGVNESWQFVNVVDVDNGSDVDGGFAGETYLITQRADGGGA